MTYNKCRLCTSFKQDGLVKYSTRHYVHATCGINKWGAGFFDRLRPWQISQLPYFPLKDAGLLEEARRRRMKGESK